MLISEEPDMEVCGAADNANDAFKAVTRTRPDIVLVDISLKASNGLDLIGRIRSWNVDIPVLVVSMHHEAFFAERALQAGARGYVTKQSAEETIVEAMRKVLGGGIYLSETLTQQVLRRAASGCPGEALAPVGSLSNRELEVFQLIGRGLRAGQIAEQLGLSVKTIETHQAHIKEKLGIQAAPELVQYAVEWTRSLPGQ